MVAFHALSVDEYILNTDISVKDTSHVMEISMSYRVGLGVLVKREGGIDTFKRDQRKGSQMVQGLA